MLTHAHQHRLLMSSWYLPSEFPQRVAIMYCGNTIANGFGGLLAAGVLGGMDGLQGLAGWRYVSFSWKRLALFLIIAR